MFKCVAIEREERPVPTRGEEPSQSGGLLLTLAAPPRWRPSRLPPPRRLGDELEKHSQASERAQVMTRCALLAGKKKTQVESGDVIS